MNALQRQQHEARMRTLERVRAEVDASGRIQIREPVYCGRSLLGWRPIPKTLTN